MLRSFSIYNNNYNFPAKNIILRRIKNYHLYTFYLYINFI